MIDLGKILQEQQKMLYCEICKSSTCGYISFAKNKEGTVEIVNKHLTMENKHKKAVLNIPELQLELSSETDTEIPDTYFDANLGKKLIDKLKEMGYITYYK